MRPSFFTSGEPALFTDSQRVTPLFFDYPWSELDSIKIHLPEGFDLDHADAPLSFAFSPFGKYDVKISTAKGLLIYQRQLVFGNDQALVFDASVYKQMKAVWDQIHTGDEHMITLKQGNAEAAAK